MVAMADRPRPAGSRRRIAPELQMILATGTTAVLWGAFALVVWLIAGPLPPRLFLTGAEWRWTGTTDAATGAAVTVADPGAYSIRFRGDRTFTGVADCNRLDGTYTVTTAGRAGGSVNRLVLAPGSTTRAACGPDSLSEPFVEQLGRARAYAISGSQLVITLDPPAEMTFQAAPTPGASPGG